MSVPQPTTDSTRVRVDSQRNPKSQAAVESIRKYTGGESYWGWNEALASIVYPALDEAGPAYFSLDEEQRAVIARDLGFPVEDFDEQVSRCVKGFLDFSGSGPSALFQSVNDGLVLWRRATRSERGAPPVLPLLAVLTVAAARMTSGGGMAENNFYGRVLELLGVTDPKQRFRNGYQRYGESYWVALDRWLEDNDGLRGLPTAVAIGHRFVGLPISQVLVREGDRAKLGTFFMHAGFPPGAAVPPAELAPALDQWISSEPCPVSSALEHHWQTQSTRARVLDIAAAALATWDGHLQTQDTDGSSAQVSLALNIGTFPKKRIEFSPIAYVPNAGTERGGELRTSRGWDSVDLTPFAPGIVRIGQPQSFDNKSLLEGVLRVRDGSTGKELARRPRRLMVFRRVELAGAYLEAEQIMLGEEVFIVARDAAKLVAQVEQVLNACARPGWIVLPESYGGVPEGWRIYRNVQIFRSPGDLIPESQLDLRVLAPLTNNQLIVAGGYALPGSARGKWHRDALPEIRGVSDDPDGFELRLLDFGDENADDDRPCLLERWVSTTAGAIVVNLADLELRDGNYRADLRPRSSESVVSSITLRVRSGDQLDEKQREKVGAADQFLDDPLAVLSASAVHGQTTIAGALIEGDRAPRLIQSVVPGDEQHWQTARSTREKLTVGIETVPADSCLYTGAHRTHIETVSFDNRGRPVEPYVVGTCTQCGLQRRFPSSHWKARRQSERRQRTAAAPTRPIDVEPVHNDSDSPAWDTVLDAVFHCGAGNMQTFERIAMYAEPSALMVDHLARTLFAMGHIDLMRNAETFVMESWDIAPTALVPTRYGWYLAGYWPQLFVQSQKKLAPRVKMRNISNLEAPTSRYFAELPGEIVENATVAKPAIDMALRLPRLSDVVNALPRIPATLRVSGLTAFDPVSAKWGDAAGMGQVGGYRIRRFSTDDVLRAQADLDNRTMALSTVQLSKHATAMLRGRKPLLAYDQRDETLKVPLGANLPGLYERAVVLSSGVAPRPIGRSIEYRFVPPDVAGHIGYLLSH